MNLEILKARLAALENPKLKLTSPRYFTQYDHWKVERLLQTFLASKNLTTSYSSKRKGYVIDCPGEATHEHRNRRDDCTLYGTSKSNGFIFISARCRHNSCGTSLADYCKELNQEWGEYLNSHYS